ncbi:O-linked N-acetylglucosamine transferase, SPINDLY family protein [Myxacorys almedinensis]|uniref:O-linked N-acetylglucosamine transferase, SPINDLY family protein n=1 Tax=Myxacorys almedinensis A TaxID=2690445 RepID=A0A8J7Z1P4_9CYAN|nr:O-linked N-acetylglucosamine transferase, SPINDLY family protein [Myxacorys almedinensis]NDJ17590.1 O-linked N-acetylglucosamine transferase, SPINDLY family protein [Myxacorys almedinensis A]
MPTESITPITSQHVPAYQALVDQHYEVAISLYEQAIEAEPEVRSYYWYLGLALLLHGQEADAQTMWLFAMSEGEETQIEQWTDELIQVLQTEANRLEALENDSMAWVICQHIREINPYHLENALHLVALSIRLEKLTAEELDDLQIISRLQENQTYSIDERLLLRVLKSTLAAIAPHPIVIDFTEACLPYIQTPSALMAVLLPAAIQIAYTMRQPNIAAQLSELYLRLDANNVEISGHLALFYQSAREYEKGIAIARSRLNSVDDWSEKAFSSHLLLRGLLNTGGHWQEAISALQHHETLLIKLLADQPTDLNIVHTDRLFNSCYYLPYFSDNAEKHRAFQNQIGKLCQDNIRLRAASQCDRYQRAKTSHSQPPTKRLKIGYLSHCMGSHSVGWLARWLIQHHDRDRFQINGYFYNERLNDPLQQWYINQMEQHCVMGVDIANNSLDLAEKIYQNEIDILVDLDSVTLDLTCEILSLKPAPIQLTWLGWDASGLPAVDYFIADPYVLPKNAQTYYSEKIWRLPQTYIAVDGFEIGVPTLRRDQLNIPADAITFLSAQRGCKRHRDTAKLQMQIIKEVPNSYFLIKGFADEDSIQKFFFEIADKADVARDRLRFLPDAPTESAHRANLAIADVVLDTFPYNGATTTLETLWMGIPLVTRVGEQFAARNSYTMMINAGITEGIAWSDAEYIEWGVRLGTDAALRQKIHWDLLRSRQTAPLWNAKQFTRDMEAAYQQMWEIYQRSHSGMGMQLD